MKQDSRYKDDNFATKLRNTGSTRPGFGTNEIESAAYGKLIKIAIKLRKFVAVSKALTSLASITCESTFTANPYMSNLFSFKKCALSERLCK